MHDRDIVHLGDLRNFCFHEPIIRSQSFSDIKPDNIMVNCRHVGREVIVEQVQVTDLENAAYLPNGRCIKGMLAGNENWRSPEAHFKGELNKPSDLFSFGAVVSILTWTEILLADVLSASTLCSAVLYSGLMMISKNIKRKVHCLVSFACSVKFRILGTRKD